MMAPLLKEKTADKLHQYGKSIFATMGELSMTNQAVSLAQGFPDFNPEPRLLQLADEYALKGFNQYAPMTGVKPLRDAISDKYQKFHHAAYHPDSEITITAGATQGMYVAITSIVKPGDEVIIFEPCFDAYKPSVELSGGKVIPIRLYEPDFKIDWDEVKTKISGKTSCLIFNSPNNPSGKLLTAEDFNELVKLVEGTDLTLISDEVYEHIVFGDKPFTSFASIPELAQRTIVVSSFGKTYHVTGWRVGYCAAPIHLTNVIRKVHQFMIFSASSSAYQLAIADFLRDETTYLSLSEFYEQKRDYFFSLIKGSGFKIQKPEGTFFALLDYSDLSDKNDLDFSIELVNDYKLAVIPLSSFYSTEVNTKIIRACFAKKEETLVKAAGIMKSV